ncbi:Lrp/AsnC family transcriptional regulator, partial [Chloroflexota bacterium]
MNSLNQKLLGMLQNGFPLTLEPFADLGKTLVLSENEVITRIQQFKDDGVIRQISAVSDARSLGYLTTLVAMRVPEERLEWCSRIL